jgi:putative transcriptional regulator
MITYEPFYKTLRAKGVTEYHLIFKDGIPPGTLQRMRHGGNITMKTLDTLCFVLDCDVSDIIRYVKDE